MTTSVVLEISGVERGRWPVDGRQMAQIFGNLAQSDELIQDVVRRVREEIILTDTGLKIELNQAEKDGEAQWFISHFPADVQFSTVDRNVGREGFIRMMKAGLVDDVINRINRRSRKKFA